MQTIGAFKLRNNGGFVCAGKIQYIDGNGQVQVTGPYHSIAIGQGEMMNPADKGIPSGTLIQMYIDIHLGNDRTGGTYFLYESSSAQYAEYDITGTTFDSSVHFDGIKTLEVAS